MKIYHLHPTRSRRIVWMLEEMGLEYEVVPTSFTFGERDPDYAKVNPIGTIPTFLDGDTVIYESMAAVEYIGRRYGPTPLIPDPASPSFGPYLQFLHMGEATLSVPLSVTVRARFMAPEEEKSNWSVRDAREVYIDRMRLVSGQLEKHDYVAGGEFTAADISIGYAVGLGQMLGLGDRLDSAVAAYLQRLEQRPAYQRMLAK